MEENNEIKDLFEKNDVLKRYILKSKEELKIMRMYFNLNIFSCVEGEKIKFRFIKMCMGETYNLFEYILKVKYRVENNFASLVYEKENTMSLEKCSDCCCSECIKKSISIFANEINEYNQNEENKTKLDYLEVIDYILERQVPSFNNIPDLEFFENVELIDLMYVQIILESDLINVIDLNDVNNLKFTYVDFSKNNPNEYYVNILMKYYKNPKKGNEIVINANNLNDIFTEKDQIKRVYKIAAYYKYMIETSKLDIIKKLREILDSKTIRKGIQIRDHYFIYLFFKKIADLPYSPKVKEKLYGILNYILNYNKKTSTPYIPINILLYSNDKDGIEKISNIMGEFMWYFNYFSDDISYYDESMNDIILDKFAIKNLYYIDNKPKEGILIIHNFENLMYIEKIKQSLILNILTDEIEKNNRNVCTIIYGDKDAISKIIDSCPKLANVLINLELEISDFEIDDVYNILIDKIQKNMDVQDDVKEKIYNYIKATYSSSRNKNMEFVDSLYNNIMLNAHNEYLEGKNSIIKLKDIPEAYNTCDLPTIMKNLNSLVGLENIKERVNDLVYLLKFNKKANLDINKLNLHMLFSGNPGTGKTTVARLITDIFYNLGYIKQNKLTEVIAKDLIAEYIGQTSGKTYSIVKSALGGVLFIDEAYSIMSALEFGDECIATLLKMMDDYKDKLIIIFAGYTKDMIQFQESNPGLVSRIGYKIDFPDYSIDELMKMYTNLISENNLIIHDLALNKVKIVIEKAMKQDNFGNGRFVNNLFQKILIEHSKNIEMNNIQENILEITEEDIKIEKLVSEVYNKKIGF